MGNYEHILINGNAQKKKEPVEKTPQDGYDFHDGIFFAWEKDFPVHRIRDSWCNRIDYCKKIWYNICKERVVQLMSETEKIIQAVDSSMKMK